MRFTFTAFHRGRQAPFQLPLVASGDHVEVCCMTKLNIFASSNQAHQEHTSAGSSASSLESSWRAARSQSLTVSSWEALARVSFFGDSESRSTGYSSWLPTIPTSLLGRMFRMRMMPSLAPVMMMSSSYGVRASTDAG